MLMTDTATLGVIGMGENVMGRTHYFNEDSLNAPTIQAAEALDDSETAFDIDDASKLLVGTLLMDMANGKQEVLLVTAISSNALTVTRGYGSTDAEAHDDDAVFAVIGAALPEGDETIADYSKARTQVTLYTQIFKSTVKVSGSAEAEAANGLHPGIPSEMRLQMMRRTDELKVQLNRAILNSVISAAASDSVGQTMKGLREFLVKTSSANVNTTAEALSEQVVNDLYQAAWEDGGNPETLIGHADQITKFGTFNAQRLRVGPSDKVAGVFVSHYLTSIGQQIALITDRWMKSDEVALIEKSKVFFCPMKGRTLFAEPLARVGDAMRWQILMEGCLKVLNAAQAHAYHTALSV